MWYFFFNYIDDCQEIYFATLKAVKFVLLQFEVEKRGTLGGGI